MAICLEENQFFSAPDFNHLDLFNVGMVFVYFQAVIVSERRKTDPFYLFCCIFIMAISVAEFSREGYKIRNLLATNQLQSNKIIEFPELE